MEEFCGGPFWDYDQLWNTDDPDFTACFQLTVLVWIPCAFYWLFAPLEIYYIKTSRYANIPYGFLSIFRYIILAGLIIISLADLIMAATMIDEFDVYNVHIVTPGIKIATFLLSGIFAYYQKKSGIQSSGHQFLFWFVLFLFAIPQYRTEFRNFDPDNNTIGYAEIAWHDFQFITYMIYFPLVTFQFIAHIFSDREPLEGIDKMEKRSPELSASVIRKWLFLWFDRMIWIGFRKPLTADDLHNINPEDRSKEIVPVFDKYWAKSVASGTKGVIKAGQKKSNKAPVTNNGTQNTQHNNGIHESSKDRTIRQTNGSIVGPMFRGFGGPFWFAGFLKLIIDLLSFASPQLLNLLINFTGSDEPFWRGMVYAIGLFVVSILTAILNGQYLYKTFMCGFRVRSALISAVYRKAIKISSFSKRDTTVGEIVNLMAVDAQRFYEIASYLHNIWAGPLVIALAVYFLWQVLGVAVISGIVILLLMIPLNGYVATKMRTLQIEQMKMKDERVKVMNEILSGIKVLKLYAWEPSFEKAVQKIRNGELALIRKLAIWNAATFFLWSMAPFLVSIASFATYVLMDENNVLTANTAFVALSLFNILRMPMIMFPTLIAMLMQALVSVKRLNEFMNSEEIDPDSVTNNKSENAISITNGTFTWGSGEPILKDINFKMIQQQLVAIVGPVGAGKSSFISALLGEMEKVSGQVNTYGSIALVSQQAWIQNATLRENILFGKSYDPKQYEKVLNACALKSDIDMLPGGDQTEIGEKGINLSGGQKQRVSLARAVYSNSDIYLLDDPLSAVDSHVGKHIFDNVIGPNGILSGKSILLVTHGISYLPYVSSICVMSNGEITESGTYTKLIAQRGAFADFIIQHVQEIDDDDEELREIKEVLSENSTSSQLFQRAISIRNSNSSLRGSIRKRLRRNTSNISDLSTEKRNSIAFNPARLIEKEESATGSVSLGVYFRYFSMVGLFYLSTSVFANVANQGFSVYSNVWLAQWASDPDAAEPHVRDMYLGVFGALGVGQAIFLLITSLAIAFGCLNAARDLHNNLLVRTFRLPMSFFDTTPLGRVMNRFSKDVDVVDNTLPMFIRFWMQMFFSTIAVFIVISISTPIFLSVIIPIFIIYYIIQKFYIDTSRQVKRLESVTRSPIYSHFGESISGQSTIRAYNVQNRFISQSESSVDFNQKCTFPGIVAQRWMGVRLELVGGLVVLFAAIFAVLGRDTINGAIVGLSISYALQVTLLLGMLIRTTVEVETNIVANERLEEYSTLDTEAPWIAKPVEPTWPAEGEVIFENFKLRYRENLELVLKGISFKVNSGEKVGIVGRTGAGKSSLTLALFRIIEGAEGKIFIDNVDISELGLHSLRSRLTIIPQDPVLFSGTLRMNIDPFDAFSDDEIWHVLEHSHLKAFVKGLPAGLLHPVSEGGENLSVGQRQLVCLGRALLRKTKILILDEATAAVDLETDDLIQKTIRTQFRDCTILTIAHRLNTIMDSDRVIVLDKGLLAEFDTPESLLKNSNSIFFGMAKDAGLVSNNNNNNNNNNHNIISSKIDEDTTL